ncbi:conserved repeat domain protein [Pirellula staleyi DSM 6068]|uniref:Conserved repeat domain protein n=1 Tax=Pirellula staleyi (strain ATCC 27377 / DSM 6068 / ICPB 4128) TaxID=530564 RepID=D2R3H9_PIRSD|nr:DUF11 domain-containing protein [Pirellula staleyi]ADB15210.1 conserved repeat domain protein [Pirellula staleyi DSM 6068]
MSRFWEAIKRAKQRVNTRLAILIVVIAGASYGGYLGIVRLTQSKPVSPTKKVVTGGGQVAPPAVELEIPGAPPAAANTQQASYNEASLYPSSSPSPYTVSDAPPAAPPSSGGYGYDDATSPATEVPAAPATYGVADDSPAVAAPSNPYRESLASNETAVVTEEPPVAQPPTALPAEDPYAQGSSNAYGTSPAPATASPYGAEPAPLAESSPPQFAPETAAGSPAVTEPEPSAYGPPSAYGSSRRADLPADSGAPVDAGSTYGAAAPAYSSSSAEPRSLAPQTIAMSDVAGLGVPGERELEGTQAPAISVEKLAPAEIQVGRPAVFEIRVRNAGQSIARQVLLSDFVPQGTKLIASEPQFTRGPEGSLLWQLGDMQPGDEKLVKLELMPLSEGEIGSVAQVTFAAMATSRSLCTKPALVIEHTAPAQILIGESMTMAITVTNPGTGAATGVVVEEDVPAGLSHLAGSELEYEIGTLRPGESKRLELSIKAEKAGIIENTIVVRGEGNLAAEHKVNIEVLAPQLSVNVDGPKRRFLERQAKYNISVGNPGTAAARDVELVAYLPKGMKFVETDSRGQYDAQQHAVFWSLAELPASKAGTVQLTTMPIETGELKLRVEGRGAVNLQASSEQLVQVEAAAELLHTIADLSDPIEVGSETGYEVRVTNVGTKAATNVRILATLPPDMRATGGDGPTRATSDGQRVQFEPLARLNPQEEVVFRVTAQGLKAGDQLIRVQVSSDEWQTPVTREESTRVYDDR